MSGSTPKVAVIGAGISGLMGARTLVDYGYCVTVFEKSRGLGGRMAIRRANGNLRFDHGAQYFTARDSRFKRYVKSWSHDGIVAPWLGRIVALEAGAIIADKSETDRFVAVPGMNAICKHLAADVEVHFKSLVTSPRRAQDRWQLTSDEGIDLGYFEAVLVSTPASQAADLLRAVPHLADQAERTKMSGCCGTDPWGTERSRSRDNSGGLIASDLVKTKSTTIVSDGTRRALQAI